MPPVTRYSGLCFLHGLDSSPQGTKARLIRNKYPNCLIPALPPDLTQRLRILEREITQPVWMVGSSLGGLTALMFADRFPGLVRAMVLTAPAVGCTDRCLFDRMQEAVMASVYIPAGIPAIILAGRRDDLIPLDAIRSMIRRSPPSELVRLIVVDDGHDLHGSLDLMLQLIEEIQSFARSRPPKSHGGATRTP